jgi:hypothetical protein
MTAEASRRYAANVSSGEDVLRVFGSVDHDFGEPDLVVFNAGALLRRFIAKQMMILGGLAQCTRQPPIP